MRPLQITDVRALPGDSAFLIDDGKTAVLCDAGFGFTGFTIADNVKRALGERPLDYIFLTHSHYDHALGAPYVLSRYPATPRRKWWRAPTPRRSLPKTAPRRKCANSTVNSPRPAA